MQAIQSEDHARILVVDDDHRNVELLQTYLGAVGYEVDVAYNGEEALKRVKEAPPDLVLLDIMMPKVDGYQVCERIKRDPETCFIPVVMVTALRETEQRIRALEAGADDFLSKPFNIYELAARVRSLLRIKRQHDELERRNALFYNILSRYLAAEVAEQILHDPEHYLKRGGETREVTVLFADIRGFTHFAETQSADRVLDVLNSIFNTLHQAVIRWRGTFDKFLGDAIMAFYGAPVSYQDDVLRALRTALDMQEEFARLRGSWEGMDAPDLALGIGIHTGEAIVGNVGSEQLWDYTVIGDTVNVARRLQEMAGAGEILISEATYERVQDRVKARPLDGVQYLRGRREPIVVYLLEGLLV